MGCPQAAQRGGGGVMASLSADFFGDGQAMWYTLPSWNFTDDPGAMGWPQAGQLGSLGAGSAVKRKTSCLAPASVVQCASAISLAAQALALATLKAEPGGKQPEH
jgi:hypothetical protein